ncbi:MAG: carbohydrate ABC transporter permease [Phycisphaerales bacterium]
MKRKPRWISIAGYGAGLLLTVAAVGPALWLLLIALQPAGADMTTLSGAVAPLVRGRGTLEHFATAWTSGGLATPLLNSVLVTTARAAANVVLAALAAYPLARMRFRGRHTVFVLILATMMIPEQVLLTPMFRTVVGLGMYDTLIAAVIPFSVSAFGVYLCKQAFEAVPNELCEAAEIDGAGHWRTFVHVMLPLAAPTLSTLALFSFLGAWSELLWPLIVLESRDHQTLPVAVNALLGQFSTNLRAAYAAAVMTLLPVIAVLLACQRFLRAEMFAGAVKG